MSHLRPAIQVSRLYQTLPDDEKLRLDKHSCHDKAGNPLDTNPFSNASRRTKKFARPILNKLLHGIAKQVQDYG